MVKIITDSTSDLTKEILERYNIDVLPLYVHMGDNEYKDGVDITPDDIYKWSDENKTTPKTAAPSIEDAINAIKPYKEAGDDVIMFAISEDMSCDLQQKSFITKNTFLLLTQKAFQQVLDI